MAPAGCEVTQLLINIIGSRGRSNVIRRMASPGEMQYEEFISLEQLPDRRGTYTFSVQALGLDGNSSQSSAKVGKYKSDSTYVAIHNIIICSLNEDHNNPLYSIHTYECM